MQRAFVQTDRFFSPLTRAERALLKRLNTPQKIQEFLDTKLRYNTEDHGETCQSVRQVLKSKQAHCIEGALFACAALRFHGHKPLIVDMEGKRDFDHVICVFKQNGYWGAISKSRYHTLGWRDPIFRTVRELVLSYFVFYNNNQGTKTLHTYSVPVNLTKFDKVHWLTSEESLWDIGNHLFTVKHFPIIPPEQRKYLKSFSKAFIKADTMRAH